MIRHVSIPARDPRHVATVLAEVMQGRVYPFPGPVPGAFMAVPLIAVIRTICEHIDSLRAPAELLGE